MSDALHEPAPLSPAQLSEPPASPLISVILPAYKVQAYLRICLDSIVGQPFSDFEVIAVDDCSPDGCGVIFDEYAAKDERIQVLHLERNVGLGEARNVGLRHARGEYVWFIDSDDWIDDDAMAAIAARLSETRPDVLFFDYARTYWNNKAQRNVLNYLFREPPAPGVFALHERPSAMHIMMTAWNKAIRREFLLDLGLSFGHGYYEDLPVTYPILMAAERISLLDRVCYYYRQRRSGAITRTKDAKHFDVFDQYEKIFDFMAARESTVGEFRSRMFDRMMWHYFIILGRGDRVSRSSRREFFQRMSEHYGRFRPATGHTLPAGQLGLKYRLVGRSSYLGFAALRLGNAAQRIARGKYRSLYTKSRSAAGRLRSRALRLYYRWQLGRPIDDNLAVYAAYWYRGYACNPAAIFASTQELAPHIRGVWIVHRHAEKSMPEGVEYVFPNTLGYFRVLARAKFLVNNTNFPNEIVKRRGSVHLQTQHGTPLKKMGLDLQQHPVGAAGMDFHTLLRRSDRWDFNLSANRFSTEVWERVYPCDYESLEAGYPRNDIFYRATSRDVQRVRGDLGVRPDQRVVLYAPTFRNFQPTFEPQVDLRRLARELGPGTVILVRAHYYFQESSRGVLPAPPHATGFASPESCEDATLLDVSDHPSTEELCLAADVLITDYSSVMFDYANLDRPIVVYAPDWHTYVHCRGVNFDLLAEPPGAVATTEDELVEVLRSGEAWGVQATKARAEFRRRFCEFDDGHAAERVVRRVFLDEPVLPPVVEAVPAPVPSDTTSDSAPADC